ncbi:MAG: hypothetical protein U0869_06115 [Chloroflexota bacterium]
MADAIDRVKTSRADVPLIAVGGGSSILDARIPGVSEVLRPENHDVANATRAIAAVSGTAEEVVHFRARGHAEAIAATIGERAKEAAVAAGADPARVSVVDVEETPLTYLMERPRGCA